MAACTDCLSNLPSHRLGISILVIKKTLKVFEDGQQVNLSNKPLGSIYQLYGDIKCFVKPYS